MAPPLRSGIPHYQRITSLLVGIAIAPLAWSQVAPDAGTLQQQIDRERAQPLPRPATPPKPAAPGALKPFGTSVTVKQFRFAGNTLISAERLARVVADYLGRPLDFADLQAAATAVANAYREAGWVVRAYLPQQEIVDGVVTIQVVEAVFGKLRTEGSVTRITAPDVLRRFEVAQASGQPINTDNLDRALLLADDLPGVAVAGTLVPGAADKETDLAVKLADEPLVVGEANIDNTGSRATGEQRLTGNLNLNSPLGIGDLLGGNLIHTQGSDYVRLAYSLPVGADGWRVGINASRLDYRLVAAEFRNLAAKGTSSTVGLDASYPLVRSRLRNLFLSLAFDDKRFDNEANRATSSRYGIRSVSIGLTGNLFDTLGGGGANSASLHWAHGDVSLGTLDASENATVRGGFDKLRYSLARQQVLTPDLSLFAMVSGQWASKNLDSSEKFYLGGANGVRAYPTSEAGGSDGQMLNLELRWKLPLGFTVTAFRDEGRITQFKENFAGADTPNTYALRGHGVSLAWEGPLGSTLKATWARRSGSNPNADATTGRDQDGSLDRNRWWLSASLPF